MGECRVGDMRSGSERGSGKEEEWGRGGVKWRGGLGGLGGRSRKDG